MPFVKKDHEAIFSSRRRKLLSLLKGECLLIPSSPTLPMSLDQNYPFKQNSDLFYLTGILESDSALFLVGGKRGPRSILFLKDRDLKEERWVGERIGLKRARKQISVDEVRDISNLKSDLSKLIEGTSTIYYPSGTHPDFDQFIFSLLRTSLSPRVHVPHTLKDSRLLTSEMRMVKDREEISTIKHAVNISTESFYRLFKTIALTTSELHAARVLEASFAQFGASGIAFPTIVASGKNATCLHHHPKLQPLWKKELVLIDAGASFNGYCADITRTIPVSGKFTKAQAELYQIVLNASNAAIARARAGESFNSLHKAAAREITKGLLELKLLRGNVNHLMKEKSYKKFFMHNIGHHLGIDVHDINAPISKLTDSNLTKDGLSRDHLSKDGARRSLSPIMRPLVAGNVITIEPGIYLDPKDEKIPKHFRGIGIRIEDNILITGSGNEVLSKGLAKEIDDLENLYL